MTCFNWRHSFSFLFNLTFTTTSPLPIDFTECSATVYTVDCLSLSRIVNAFPSLHICFVAPLSITHILVLFISFALQAIAIIASSVLFDSFYFGFNLQKRLMCPFSSQLKHLPLNLFTFVFMLFRLLFTSICFRLEQFLVDNALSFISLFVDWSLCLASSSISFIFKFSSDRISLRDSITNTKHFELGR